MIHIESKTEKTRLHLCCVSIRGNNMVINMVATIVGTLNTLILYKGIKLYTLTQNKGIQSSYDRGNHGNYHVIPHNRNTA